MAGSATIDFYFEFASTYSYPAAMRIEALASSAGVGIGWRPFLLGPIFGSQGWNDSPFNIYPAKGAYMWRDLERICRAAALPLRHPSVFPRNGLTAARVACAGAGEPWLPAYVRAVFTANFGDDRDIADAGVIVDCLARAGAPAPDAWLARAADPPVKEALRANTERAVALGIFGAPSMIANGELFWGNDRLADALAEARRAAADQVR